MLDVFTARSAAFLPRAQVACTSHPAWLKACAWWITPEPAAHMKGVLPSSATTSKQYLQVSEWGRVARWQND